MLEQSGVDAVEKDADLFDMDEDELRSEVMDLRETIESMALREEVSESDMRKYRERLTRRDAKIEKMKVEFANTNTDLQVIQKMLDESKEQISRLTKERDEEKKWRDHYERVANLPCPKCKALSESKEARP